jgi:hypothetical protein
MPDGPIGIPQSAVARSLNESSMANLQSSMDKDQKRVTLTSVPAATSVTSASISM